MQNATITAKVTPTFLETYDAGAMYVYINEKWWLKFAFERDERMRTRIVTVRTIETSDDNNHDVVDTASVYMKISSDTKTIGYYYSNDGEFGIQEIINKCLNNKIEILLITDHNSILAIHKKVMNSFPVMIKNLDKLGIKVNENEVLEKADGKLPCGELIAEVLLTNKDYHSNKSCRLI